MSKELVISANRHETRVAILEDDQVVEIFHQRENEYSLAGSIHKGRVTRVLPGMQSAFVDIGLGRDAFLYVSDFFEDNEEYDKIVTSVEDKVLKLDRVPAAQVAVEETAVEAIAAVPIETADPLPVDVVTLLSPPESAMQGPAGASDRRGPRPGDRGQERPGDRGADRGGDRGGDRERRGRRSRRGRGQRGNGGGLPDSKFYQPRPEGETRHAAPSAGQGIGTAESEPVPSRVVFDPEQDDFFVLPGESLAKYTQPGDDDPYDDLIADLEPRAGEIVTEFVDAESSMAEAATAEEMASEPEIGRESGIAEPVIVESAVPELPLVEPVTAELVRAVSVAQAVPAEPVAASEPLMPSESVQPPAVEQSITPEVAQTPRQVVVLDTEFVATHEAVEAAEAAALDEALQTLEGERSEGDAESDLGEEDSAEGEIASTEYDAEGDAGDVVPTDAGAVDEGPEPARIPTSLTATLREQGGRYPHRVSRRTRRKGRSDRGPAPEGQRGPQSEGRPADPRSENRGESRPDTRNEQRTVSRPEARSEARSDPRGEKAAGPSISDLLKEGQEIIVQIAKEPLGQKGARITSHVALPGRFLVYMPSVDHIGVSRKIPSDDERLRLKRILQSNRTGIPGGFIVRTAGDGRTEEELRADMMFLYNSWLDMRQKAERRAAPVLIHHDLNVVERILRDQLTSVYKSVWVDNEEVYESVLRFVQRFQPALVNRVKMYTRSTPIFDAFGVTAELEKALRPKVWLKSGGYIVINQTEALVAIDINTGKYVGKSNRLEDTIVKTNTDAIKEIVRQIRLRDLGGIIVVDFIDMDERKNRQKVMQALEEAMRVDRAPYKILQFNDFGLVAITRKRVKQSLERTLCTPCPICEGAGYVKSPQTVVGEILIEANKIARAVDTKDVMLRVGAEVAKVLKSNQNTYLQEIEEILGKPVIVKSDAQLHPEKFDLA
jgi:ribonuclease G